jgi:hypothetical protein
MHAGELELWFSEGCSMYRWLVDNPYLKENNASLLGKSVG